MKKKEINFEIMSKHGPTGAVNRQKVNVMIIEAKGLVGSGERD